MMQLQLDNYIWCSLFGRVDLGRDIWVNENEPVFGRRYAEDDLKVISTKKEYI